MDFYIIHIINTSYLHFQSRSFILSKYPPFSKIISEGVTSLSSLEIFAPICVKSQISILLSYPEEEKILGFLLFHLTFKIPPL